MSEKEPSIDDIKMDCTMISFLSEKYSSSKEELLPLDAEDVPISTDSTSKVELTEAEEVLNPMPQEPKKELLTNPRRSMRVISEPARFADCYTEVSGPQRKRPRDGFKEDLIEFAKSDDEIKQLFKIHKANPEMSAYECRRKLNIINNEKLLKSLGVKTVSKSLKVKPKAKRSKHPMELLIDEDYFVNNVISKAAASGSKTRRRKSGRSKTSVKKK